MKRIWFNHWFSTVYLMIEMLKQADREYYIIGSNDKENAVYRAVCDEWYQEPVLSETEYIQYCLNFCREHRVDIFIPRRQFLSVSRHKSLSAFPSNRLPASTLILTISYGELSN